MFGLRDEEPGYELIAASIVLPSNKRSAGALRRGRLENEVSGIGKRIVTEPSGSAQADGDYCILKIPPCLRW